MKTADKTILMYRPVGPKELELIAASDFHEFPPRLFPTSALESYDLWPDRPVQSGSNALGLCREGSEKLRRREPAPAFALKVPTMHGLALALRYAPIPTRRKGGGWRSQGIGTYRRCDYWLASAAPRLILAN